MFGVPHSEVIIVSCPRCHQKSYASCCGPRSCSHWPFSSKVFASIRKMPPGPSPVADPSRSEEHTSELQSPMYLVCRLLLEKKKKNSNNKNNITIIRHDITEVKS